MVAQIEHLRYETPSSAAMMKAAAPSVGGDMMAPIPAAARTAPPCSFGYPALRSSGQEMPPRVTVVATPEPDTVPSRKPARVTVRPGPDFDCPKAENDRSMKNRVAPEAPSTAP